MRPKRHWFRALAAGLFGAIALNLILASILVVWLNRTLTDTDTYVRTVAPLVTKPDIQQLIGDKAAEALLQSAPPAETAAALLPQQEIAGKTPDELQDLVRTTVSTSIIRIIDAPKFQDQWVETNRAAHVQIIGQLESNSSELTLDLSPLVRSALDELKATKLAAISDKIVIKEDAGKINLKGGAIDKAHNYYQQFQKATMAIVAVTLLAIMLCVWISVEHWRTLRRILLGTAVVTLISAAALQAPSLISIKGVSHAEQQAARALAAALFHDLQLALIIIGVSCLVLAILSKIWSKYKRVA